MNMAEKERVIAQIVCREISATVFDRKGKPLSLYLRSPTPKEQAESAIIYSIGYQNAIAEGLPDEEELMGDMITLGRWTHEKDDEIEGIQKDIHNIRRGLLDLLFNKTKLESVRSLLRRAESALLKRLSQKHSLVQNSAEAHAAICQQRYLIQCITRKEDDSLFWRTDDDFERFEDVDIIVQLCDIFFFKSHFSTKIIRELARSQEWRLYWEIAKNTNDLFDGSVSSWSWNQRELGYWSTVYDSVTEAYERPSRDIVIDDDLLDSWFIRQGEKSDKRIQDNSISKPNKPGRNEEFIMADKEGAKRVYAMNDSTTRAQIKARQKLLSKQGSIKEQDMPDSQREMRQQMMEKQRRHVKDIGRR